jgi:hypothetical protein
MKKLIIVALSILLTEFSLSQQMDSSEYQQKKYIREKLTIETKGMAVGSYNKDLGLGMLTSWRKWQAYQGFYPISEAYFFHIAGYEKEARIAKKYRTDTQYMFGGGFLLFLVGSISVGVGLIKDNGGDFGYLMIGSISYIFGTALIWSSMARSTKNWAPCSLAYDIAEEYNRKLLLQIKGNF